MQLPPYVLIEPVDELKDKVLIMQTTPPYIIGQVWRFRTREESHEWLNRNAHTPICIITGYRMHISYNGHLPHGKDWIFPVTDAMIIDVLHEMRDYFMKVRIAHRPEAFKKYETDYSGN